MIWAAILLTFHALGLVSSMHAVMRTRTSQGTIAWLFSLNTIPEITVPLYWIFGRNRFQGYVTAHKVAGEVPKKFFKDLTQHLAPFGMTPSEMKDTTHAAERLADFPILRGNAVELLIDGEATFESILEGIDSASEAAFTFEESSAMQQVAKKRDLTEEDLLKLIYTPVDS